MTESSCLSSGCQGISAYLVSTVDRSHFHLASGCSSEAGGLAAGGLRLCLMLVTQLVVGVAATVD